MTRWRTRPASRLHRIPAATNSAERLVERESFSRASASPVVSVNFFVWRRLAERAAGTARSVSVDAEVFVFYLNVDILRQLRPGMKRRERRVTARRLIERGDADEPMDARLRREQAVRVLAGDRERHALEARLFARLVVDHLALESASLRPPH